MPFKTTETVDPISGSLRSLVREAPDLRDAARLYETILMLLRDADLHVGTAPLTREQVRDKLMRGQPVISGLEFSLDVEAVRELMIKLLSATEAGSRKKISVLSRLSWFQPPSGSDSTTGRIRRALEDRTLDIGALLQYIASGDRATLACAAGGLGLDQNLLWIIAQNALKPALRDLCRRISPLIGDVEWREATCFVCGAAAMLGELQGNGQTRHLRCGTCGADWTVPRMQCIYCGNEDHQMQQNLYTKNQADNMRVEACDHCKGYIKVISSFAPASPEMLSVQDIASLHLDYIAQGRGYVRHVVRASFY